MPYSSIDRMIWDDPWFRALPPRTRLLWLFAWSNARVNPACCYRIVLEDMARAVGFDGMNDPEFTQALEDLAGHMTYFAAGYLWVHGFVHHQTGSPQYLRGVQKCLEREMPPDIARKIVEHNARRGVAIPHEDRMNTVPDTVVETPDTVVNTTPQEQDKILRARRATAPASPNNNSRGKLPEHLRPYHTKCMEVYQTAYMAWADGEKPLISGADAGSLARVLRSHGDDAAWPKKVLAVVRACRDDPWCQEHTPSLSSLLAGGVFNRVLGELARGDGGDL